MPTVIRAVLLLILILPPVGAMAAISGWKPLFEPAELADLLQPDQQLRIIRVTGNYRRGHLPGSIESDYADWRGTGRNPGELRSLQEYTALLQRLGISNSTPVVVVHQGSDAADMGAATRVYWTLKTLGVEQVSVINGGYSAWVEQNLPTTTVIPSITASSFQPEWHDDWRVTTAEVEALVESGAGRLIDARPVSFYRGLRATLGEPGTIRGATNLEYDSWFVDNRLSSRASLAVVLAEQSLEPTSAVVSFCNTGHWASINWFVMSEVLGNSDTRLYAESVASWSELPRPMDNQVGRLAIYRDLTVRWLRDLFGSAP